jgi:competence protein ComK
MLDNYEINMHTIAIIPIKSKVSKVIESDDSFLVKKSTTEIIDDSCRYFGSSYAGRFEGTKSLIGFNYKSPIIIEETTEIIFFPTSSPRFDSCYWISLKHISNYSKNGNGSNLIFDNGQKIEICISYSSLENQILRATRLESILRQRKMTENKLK